MILPTIYAVFMTAAWFAVPHLAFLPPSPTYAANAPGLVTLRAGDGRIVARVRHADPADPADPASGRPAPRGTVIFAHGNAMDMGDLDSNTAPFRAAGFDVVTFDYRGYGRSTGAASVEHTYEDIDAVYRYVVDDLDVDPADVLVVGQSIGGGSAAWLAEHRPVGGLLLWSSMSSLVAATAIPTWVVPFDVYETAERLPHLDVPVAIVHGDADEIVPVRNGRTNFAAAHDPKRLLVVPGAGHDDAGAGTPEFEALIEWMAARMRRG